MTQRQSSYDRIFGLVDRDTPFGEKLQGTYKRSGAYRSLNERLPIILTRIIDSLSREKDEIVQKYGKTSADDLKQVIGKISKLKNELVTNKPFTPLVYAANQNETNSDIVTWNDYLVERTTIDGKLPSWYNTIELYAECYMYRRIMEAFFLTETLNTFDPFAKLKQESFYDSISSIVAVSSYTVDLISKAPQLSEAERKSEFSKLLRVGLWGNRCDLSLSAGETIEQTGDPLQLLSDLEEDIVIDNTESVWNLLVSERSKNKQIVVDILLDNTGYELFSDLCVATFFTSHKIADKVRFFVKKLPWFISDVTSPDIHYMIETMIGNPNAKVNELGKQLKSYFKTGVWTIEEEHYFTSPFVFDEMKKRDAKLYAKLSEASLIIVKGDLNYRKLVCDVHWEQSTSIDNAIGEFRPTNIVALRSIKSDVISGMKPQHGPNLDKENPMWMFTGENGLIQAYIAPSQEKNGKC